MLLSGACRKADIINIEIDLQYHERVAASVTLLEMSGNYVTSILKMFTPELMLKWHNNDT